jgi:hypothetical protein
MGVNNPGSGGGGTAPYKSYVALISQSGTSDPTVTVLQNELSGTITWTRSSIGVYLGNLTGVFLQAKTFFLMNGLITFTTTTMTYANTFRVSNDNIEIQTEKMDPGVPSVGPLDGVLTYWPIEIRIYP